jgi:hypothetical protein
MFLFPLLCIFVLIINIKRTSGIHYKAEVPCAMCFIQYFYAVIHVMYSRKQVLAGEPGGSSPHSQQPATGPYLEPVESNPHRPANLSKIHSDPIYALVFRVVSFLRALPPKPCTLFSPVPCVLHALPTSFALT